MEFREFKKIEQIGKLYMSITQKLHGSNGQICIAKEGEAFKIGAGSRNRWLTPDDDNYGFARFVYDNHSELTATLGEGTHYGEWCGLGINSGEGLKEKRFYLFNWRRHKDTQLPNRVDTVPVLYTGKFDLTEIDRVFEELKLNGSKIVPGYMKPEGIVIEIDGKLYKKVFNPEETKWNKSDTPKIKYDRIDVSHLLQPIRLQKLLSRDEAYVRNYPENMRDLFSLYYQDLLEEGQVTGTEDEINNIKKSLGKELFRFIKYHMENANESKVSI